MRLIATVGVFASLVGCTHFPSANVCHSHADRVLIQGSRVVPSDETTDPLRRHTGVSKIIAGDRVVLLVEDSDSRPGWYDSGSSEGLVVEVPALRRRTSWKIGSAGAQVWMWHDSAWVMWQAEGTEGTVETDTVDGYVWSICVDLRARWAGFRVSEDAVELRHDFTLLPVSYAEFQRSDAGWWTR